MLLRYSAIFYEKKKGQNNSFDSLFALIFIFSLLSLSLFAIPNIISEWAVSTQKRNQAKFI